MKIQLSIDDLQQAVAQYLAGKGISVINSTVDVTLVAKRNGESYAVIDIRSIGPMATPIHEMVKPVQLELDLGGTGNVLPNPVNYTSESEPVIPEKFQGLDL